MIANLAASLVLDYRALARGYDVGVQDRDSLALEVKRIKQSRGGVMFTDREGAEATPRRSDYWLVVVGNLETNPLARLIQAPSAALEAKCQYQTTIAASWRATVAVA